MVEGESAYPPGSVGRQWQDQRQEAAADTPVEIPAPIGRDPNRVIVVPRGWARLLAGAHNVCADDLDPDDGQLGSLFAVLEEALRKRSAWGEGAVDRPNDWPDPNDPDEQAGFDYISNLIRAWCCCRKRLRELNAFLEEVRRRIARSYRGGSAERRRDHLRAKKDLDEAINGREATEDDEGEPGAKAECKAIQGLIERLRRGIVQAAGNRPAAIGVLLRHASQNGATVLADADRLCRLPVPSESSFGIPEPYGPMEPVEYHGEGTIGRQWQEQWNAGFDPTAEEPLPFSFADGESTVWIEGGLLRALSEGARGRPNFCREVLTKPEVYWKPPYSGVLQALHDLLSHVKGRLLEWPRHDSRDDTEKDAFEFLRSVIEAVCCCIKRHHEWCTSAKHLSEDANERGLSETERMGREIAAQTAQAECDAAASSLVDLREALKTVRDRVRAAANNDELLSVLADSLSEPDVSSLVAACCRAPKPGEPAIPRAELGRIERLEREREALERELNHPFYRHCLELLDELAFAMDRGYWVHALELYEQIRKECDPIDPLEATPFPRLRRMVEELIDLLERLKREYEALAARGAHAHRGRADRLARRIEELRRLRESIDEDLVDRDRIIELLKSDCTQALSYLRTAFDEFRDLAKTYQDLPEDERNPRMLARIEKLARDAINLLDKRYLMPAGEVADGGDDKHGGLPHWVYWAFLPCCPTMRPDGVSGWCKDNMIFVGPYHPGAAQCFRSHPPLWGNGAGGHGPGQQCCYDDQGNLIPPHLAGAGTPDLAGTGRTLLGTQECDPTVFGTPEHDAHSRLDVGPFERLGWEEYNEEWTPDTGCKADFCVKWNKALRLELEREDD